MLNLKIAIVEDNPESSDLLKKHLLRYQKENPNTFFSFYIFDDGFNILDDFRPIYDIILLDIEMEHIDGIKTAERIREIDKDVIIIFVTNMIQYAIKGYAVNALNYLLKPVPYFAFAEEITKSIERIKQTSNFKQFIIITSEGVKKINSNEVMFIESLKHHLLIHTVDEVYEIRDALKKYEELLKDYNFNRANNSYLINLDYVKGVENDFALVGNHKLKISRMKKKQFMEHLVDYLGDKL